MSWTLKRLLVSAFVTAQLTAVTIWILPDCEIKNRYGLYFGYYMLPLAQWQYWGMFSPEPMKEGIAIEATVLDAKGMLHTFAFPKEANRTPLDAMLHYRHSKYAANFALKEFKAPREFAARHVLRQLRLAPELYPVEVELLYSSRPAGVPGGPPLDLMTPPLIARIESYRFENPREAQP